MVNYSNQAIQMAMFTQRTRW